MKYRAYGILASFLLALPVAAWAQEDENFFKLPAGTTLEVRLMNTLSTRTNQEGDPFSGRLVESIIRKGEDVVPAGSIVEGRVTFAKEAGRIKGKAEMRLIAESLTTPQDVKYLIVAGLENARGMDGAKLKDKEGTIEGGGTSTKGGAIETGIGAGAGAAVGGIFGGSGTAALYGAGVGAVAAGVRHLLKRGKDVTLPIGTELTFVISRDSIAQKVTKAEAEKPAEEDPQPPVLKRDAEGPSSQ
jgi:hypothetical protein